MTTPLDVNILNLTGKYMLVRTFDFINELADVSTQNKTLSPTADLEVLMKYEGVDWLSRKVTVNMPFTTSIKAYKDNDGVERMDIENLPIIGVAGVTELRTLDGISRNHSDHIFGPIVLTSRRIQMADVDDEFLKRGWLPEYIDHGLIHACDTSDTVKTKQTWAADQARSLIFRFLFYR